MWVCRVKLPLACNINLYQVTNVTYVFTAGNSGLMATQVKLEVIGYGLLSYTFQAFQLKYVTLLFFGMSE